MKYTKRSESKDIAQEGINPNALYTSTEVANYLRLSRTTLENFIKQGQLKALWVGRNYKVYGRDLQSFLESLEQVAVAN